MKEIARLRRDVADLAGPDRNRQQHDVHRREGRDGEAAQQPARLRRLDILFARPRREGMGAIAERGEVGDDPGRIEGRRDPFDVEPARAEIDAGFGQAGELAERRLYGADRAGIDNALDGEVHPRRAVVPAPDE